MIEFDRTNEKGDKVKAYTHKSYLSSQYQSEISKLQSKYQTWTGVTFYGTAIFSYWALHKFAYLNEFVQKKLSIKGKYLVVAASTGLVSSFFVSLGLTSSLYGNREALLKKEIFPAWFNKERVVNPERVFFELDDNSNNEPTIWHTAISESAIQRMTPDFVIGTPQKPHYPVAEHHHH